MLHPAKPTVSAHARARSRTTIGRSSLRIVPDRSQLDGFWKLAKGAVEGDLGEGALENGELLVVQLREESFRNSAHVDRRCDGQPVQPGLCQLDHDTATVGIGVGTTHQTFVNEPADAPSHAGARDEGTVRQLCPPQRASSDGQLSQDVEVGQGQTGLAFEIGLELAQKRRMGPEQRIPRLQAAPARHLPRRDAIEMSRSVRLRRYLHMQSSADKLLVLASISIAQGDLRMIKDVEVDEVLGF